MRERLTRTWRGVRRDGPVRRLPEHAATVLASAPLLDAGGIEEPARRRLRLIAALLDRGVGDRLEP